MAKVTSKPTSTGSNESSLIDVKHPDKAVPTDTARPVIVGNRPVLKDPMVNHEEARTAPELMDHSPEQKTSTPKPVKQKQETTSETAKKSKSETAPDNETQEAKVQDEPEVVGDDTTPQAKKEDPELAEAAESQHEADIQKLIDSKKYSLPINSVEKRRTKHTLVFGIVLSILLLLAWVNIALDAGLIEIDGVKPLTHFFST